MNEITFVETQRKDWERLEQLLAKCRKRGGFARLSREEVIEFGPLYRRASADLAYAQGQARNEDIIAYLNMIVSEAHSRMYETETSGNSFDSVWRFYIYEFPALLQKHLLLFLASLVLCVVGGFYGYWLVKYHPENSTLFIPKGLESSVDAWKSGNVSGGPQAEQAAFLMTHNFQVGMVCFATGFAAGIPTVAAEFQNGAMMGALAAIVDKVHKQSTLWPGIVPHGVAELTAIFICGAAGFRLGLALLFPGRFTRMDAMRLAGTDAVRLTLGTIPLFIFAGVIEGMFSHLAISAGIRYAFAAINGILWYLYLFLPRTAQNNKLA